MGKNESISTQSVGEDSSWAPTEMLVAVRKNLIVALLPFVVFSIAAAFYSAGQRKIYEAHAALAFDPNPPRPLGKQVDAMVERRLDYWSRREYYNTQYWILRSPPVLEETVRELALHTNAGFLSNEPHDMRREGKPATDDVQKAALVLGSRLSVSPLEESRLAEVKYRDASPERAARILSAVLETFSRRNAITQKSSTNEASEWLHSQMGALKDSLEESELELHQYKLKNRILSVSLDAQSNILSEEMKQLSAELTRLRSRREHVASRVAAIAKVDADSIREFSVSELLDSPVIQALRAEKVRLEMEVEGLQKAGRGEQHPSVSAVTAQLQVTNRSLSDEIANVRVSLTKDLGALSSEIGGIEAHLNAARDRALELNKLEIDFRRIERTRDTNVRLFDIVTERAKESDLARMLHHNDVQIISRPAIPRNPVLPNIPLNLSLAGGFGLLLGMALAVGRERIDRTIKSPTDLEENLQIPFLGSLPLGTEKPGRVKNLGRRERRSVSKGFELAVHENPKSPFAESVRTLRTNLVFSSPDKPYRSILVTSAGPSEGKTTMASSVAIAMAQSGHSVLLVDCDMRRPRVHSVFSAKNEVGVTSALIDRSVLDGAIQSTPVERLSLLSTGPLPPNPAELLHSKSFAQLVETLTERFDHVIFDSPPLGPVTDGAVLSRQVDGTILVFRSHQTTREQAKLAFRALRDVGANVIGTVLNGAQVDDKGYAYYRYYGGGSY